MGKPDRRRYVTGDTLANEIQQSKPKLAFVVEGHSDIIFFRNMTISGACEFFDANGKENLLEAIRIINSGSPVQFHYLGVVDADFDVIENAYNAPAYPNYVYYTDCHDMEMMCLVPEFWDKIYNEHFADKGKITLADLQRRVKEDAAALAYLHLASKRENWGMTIKSVKHNDYMSISKFYDDKTFKLLTFEELAVKVHSNKPVENFSAKKVSQKMNEVKVENHDENQLINGHHIALILVEYMKKLGNQPSTYNHDSVGKDIRLAYPLNEFRNTRLYSDLKAFQDSKGITFLR